MIRLSGTGPIAQAGGTPPYLTTNATIHIIGTSAPSTLLSPFTLGNSDRICGADCTPSVSGSQ
jgi:hypothetical protein